MFRVFSRSDFWAATALVFLLVGPATNIGSLGVLRGMLGRRAVVVYLAMIVGIALLSGALLDVTVAALDLPAAVMLPSGPFGPTWLLDAAAVLFLALGVHALVRKRRARTA